MGSTFRQPDAEAMAACRRFLKWAKGKTAAQIRAEYLKGAPSGGTVIAELAFWSAEAEKLRAERDDLKRRVRKAKVALTSDRAAHVRCAEGLWALRKPLPKGRR